jgi:ppGpp synthetase/RelA/SpoT-type nucleotidyltranferase
MISKTQIDKLGERIRNEHPNINENTIITLQDLRTSHKDTLSDIFNNLCKYANGISKTSIVTYRIKRFESIITKLVRFPEMKLNRMWDIGGCRCIMDNEKEVVRLKNKIEKELKVIKTYNYYDEPRETGYRAIHLFVSIENSDRIIEVQLRSKEDHNWATLVEITDFLYDVKIKEFGDDKELENFHRILSKRSNLNIDDKKKLAATIIKYEFFEKLSNVFTKNYVEVRKRWIAQSDKSTNKFFLIETKKDEIPRIESFSNFNQAENKYFELYLLNKNANIVLTYLNKPTYKQISIAYSNYILTFHTFIDDCFKLFETLSETTLKECQYSEFISYFTVINRLIVNHLKNIYTEIFEVNSIAIASGKTKASHLNNNEKEWIDDINKVYKKRLTYASSINNSINYSKPKHIFGRLVFPIIIKYISFKYEKRRKKLVNKFRQIN